MSRPSGVLRSWRELQVIMPAASKKTTLTVALTTKLKAPVKKQTRTRNKKIAQKRRAEASSEEESSEEETRRPRRKRSKLATDSEVEVDCDVSEPNSSGIEVEEISGDEGPNLEVRGLSADSRKLGD